MRLLADDLTGALDTAARFTSSFGPIPVVGPGNPIPDGPVAIDSGTREAPVDDATAMIRGLAASLPGTGLAFKKIDSLLRGHVAAELIACQPFFDHVVLAPAFPFQGRITRDGRQWTRDGTGWRDVGVDPASLPVAMLDAETDADLDRIVAEGMRLGGRVLWCGTAGLAGALAGRRPVPRPPLRGPVLALIGSDHPVARAQVAAAGSAALRIPAVSIPPGTPRAEAASLIATTFARVLADDPRPGVLFVSGGETLRGVCRALNAERLEVDGEVEPGVPTSILRGGAWSGQRVVSKSGAFGDTAFLNRLAELVA